MDKIFVFDDFFSQQQLNINDAEDNAYTDLLYLTKLPIELQCISNIVIRILKFLLLNMIRISISL